MFGRSLDEFAQNTGAGVFDGVVGEIEDPQTHIFDEVFAVGGVFDFANERHRLLGCSFLAFLIFFKDLVAKFLLQFMLLVLLLS